jgi:hypothetical protein
MLSTGEGLPAGCTPENTCAIASDLAATTYGLNLKEEGIEDDDSNFTRFLLLSRKGVTNLLGKKIPSKTSIVFTLPESPGALYKALACFSLRDVDFSKVRIAIKRSDRKATNTNERPFFPTTTRFADRVPPNFRVPPFLPQVPRRYQETQAAASLQILLLPRLPRLRALRGCAEQVRMGSRKSQWRCKQPSRRDHKPNPTTQNPSVARSLAHLNEQAQFLRVLGSYPSRSRLVGDVKDEVEEIRKSVERDGSKGGSR